MLHRRRTVGSPAHVAQWSFLSDIKDLYKLLTTDGELKDVKLLAYLQHIIIIHNSKQYKNKLIIIIFEFNDLFAARKNNYNNNNYK